MDSKEFLARVAQVGMAYFQRSDPSSIELCIADVRHLTGVDLSGLKEWHLSTVGLCMVAREVANSLGFTDEQRKRHLSVMKDGFALEFGSRMDPFGKMGCEYSYNMPTIHRGVRYAYCVKLFDELCAQGPVVVLVGSNAWPVKVGPLAPQGR